MLTEEFVRVLMDVLVVLQKVLMVTAEATEET